MLEASLKPSQRKSFRNRILFLSGLFITVFLILLLKLTHIQIIKKDDYKIYAQRNTLRPVRLIANRGLIFDRNHNVIVDNRPSLSLLITPAYFPKNDRKESRYRKKLLRLLSWKLKIPVRSLEEQIKKKNPFIPVVIKRNLDRDVYSQLYENKKYLKGVEVKVETIRSYLMTNNLFHLLGYTGIIGRKRWESHHTEYKGRKVHQERDYFYAFDKNPYYAKNTIVGKRGLEQYQDYLLRGEDGRANRLINSIGQPIEESTKVIRESKAGHNIYLTIDKNLQEVAKRAMNGRRGAVIVSKPATGEILAFISNPSVDPNEYVSRKGNPNLKYKGIKGIYVNRPTRGMYPPSSIFKIIVATTALENNIPPSTIYRCTGELIVGNRVFKCNDVHGKVNMVQAIEKSCNSYFYHLGLRLGWPMIYKQAKAFRLGEAISLEAGKSNEGILPNKAWKKSKSWDGGNWNRGDTLNHSIGQGYILLPPIQVHNIISIIATNGTLYKPHIILKTVDPSLVTNEITIKKIVHLIVDKGIIDPKIIIQDKSILRKANEALVRQIIDIVKNDNITAPSVIKEKIDTLVEKVVAKKVLKKVNISPKTLKILKESLRGVVENGTARWANYSRQYLIAGKTGTAQNPAGSAHAWFTGYAPYNEKDINKRIAVTVLLENPTEGGGGAIAAPIAAAIVKYYFEQTSLFDTQEEMGRNLFDVSNELEHKTQYNPIDSEEDPSKEVKKDRKEILLSQLQIKHYQLSPYIPVSKDLSAARGKSSKHPSVKDLSKKHIRKPSGGGKESLGSKTDTNSQLNKRDREREAKKRDRDRQKKVIEKRDKAKKDQMERKLKALQEREKRLQDQRAIRIRKLNADRERRIQNQEKSTHTKIQVTPRKKENDRIKKMLEAEDKRLRKNNHGDDEGF